MLPREHSAILSTFIKLPFVFNTFYLFCLFLSGRLRQILLYLRSWLQRPTIYFDTLCVQLAKALKRLYTATNPSPSSHKINTVLWRRGICFLWMRWTLNSAKPSFFYNRYTEILEIWKCYSMALMSTFEIP